MKYDYKTNSGKILLRHLAEKFDIKNLISSKKQGFSVNTVNMWNSYGKMIFLHYFDKSRLIEDKILNLNWIEKYVNKSTIDVRYVNKLLGILALEIWYRLFITQDLNSNEKLVI
jgi:asparagine synthase (glutamine-hydrolysing)